MSVECTLRTKVIILDGKPHTSLTDSESL